MTYGKVISFYSYKGGVGRSMALANIGSYLARDRKVLLIDWDLEAPGLPSYFQDWTDVPLREARGLLDYFEAIRNRLTRKPGDYRLIRDGRSRIEQIFPSGEFIVRNVLTNLDLMTAGCMSADYRSRVARFDWSHLWKKWPAVLLAFREILASRYDFILIDARTGFGDTSSICGAIMPEKLVLVLALNQQNLDGSIEIGKQCVEFRSRSGDVRPLVIFPLVSRLEGSQYGDEESWLEKIRMGFEDCFKGLFSLDDCDLTGYFSEYFLPHVAYFSCGEKLARLTREINRRGTLTRAYQDFAECLLTHDAPWQVPGRSSSG